MAKFKPLVSDATLLRVYDSMLQARAFDMRLRSLKRVRGLHTGEGAEAMLGSMLDGLKPVDLLIARKVDPLAHLLRGSSLSSILGDLVATDASTSRALYAASSSELATISGTAAEMATYAAGASRALLDEAKGKRGRQPVVLALLGEVDSARTLDAALRAIGQGGLPLVLVCCTRGKNNLQATREMLHGVPHMPVDGRDALALYRVAQESLLRVRTGLGGVLVEARLLAGDPIKLMEERLAHKGLLKGQGKLPAAFTARLDAVFRTVSPAKHR